MFAVQELRTLDIRIRDLIHIFIFCEAKFDDSGFNYTFFTKKRILGTKFLSKQSAQLIFQFFDSYQIIENENIDYGSIVTKHERKERIKRLALEIPELAIKEKVRITKSYIRNYLFENDMPKKDYSDIFDQIKRTKYKKMLIEKEGKEELEKEKEEKEAKIKKDLSYFG